MYELSIQVIPKVGPLAVLKCIQMVVCIAVIIEKKIQTCNEWNEALLSIDTHMRDGSNFIS